jgi:hypothetical protein
MWRVISGSFNPSTLVSPIPCGSEDSNWSGCPQFHRTEARFRRDTLVLRVRHGLARWHCCHPATPLPYHAGFPQGFITNNDRPNCQRASACDTSHLELHQSLIRRNRPEPQASRPSTPASSARYRVSLGAGSLLKHSSANPPGQDVSPPINIDDERRLFQ